MIIKVVPGLDLILPMVFVYVCILNIACLFLCEIMCVDPMLLEICMMKLDTLIDILVLSLQFYHLWFLVCEFSK